MSIIESELVQFYQFDNMFSRDKCKLLFPEAKIIIKGESIELLDTISCKLINQFLSIDYNQVLLLTIQNSEFYSKGHIFYLLNIFDNNDISYLFSVNNKQGQSLNNYQITCLNFAVTQICKKQKHIILIKKCKSCIYFNHYQPFLCAVNPMPETTDYDCHDYKALG